MLEIINIMNLNLIKICYYLFFLIYHFRLTMGQHIVFPWGLIKFILIIVMNIDNGMQGVHEDSLMYPTVRTGHEKSNKRGKK